MRGTSQPEAGEEPPAQEMAGQKGRQIAGGSGRQTCFTPVIPPASRKPRHLSLQLQQCARGVGQALPPRAMAPGASSSTQHSRQHQAAKGWGTAAAASQPEETHISEVVRLLPRMCILFSNRLGCEVFQKQKVILLQSIKGRFHQPAGKTSGTTSTMAVENKVSPKDNKSSR